MEQNFLKTIGIEDGDVVLSDGSGLSRDDLVTPRAVVQLLRYISQQPWGADFIATFPIAGLDGTLENRMKDTAASGRILAKTGSLEHVRAISGYATTVRGEHLVFTIFGNNNFAWPRCHGRDGCHCSRDGRNTRNSPCDQKEKRSGALEHYSYWKFAL